MNESVVTVSTSEYSTKGIYFVFKRLFDIIISLIGIVLLIPVSIIVKIAYLIDGDKDPIIFSQDRIGKDGVTFKIYKFRSMVSNADEILYNTLSFNRKLKAEYEKYKKLNNDPRITKVGKVLRKTSLDELPQLINVLKGDMSIIGNRPYLPKEMEDMSLYFNDILATKPGLTGYWQVNGRSNTDFKTRLVLEKYYSKNCSFLLDTKIFFKTFKVVLFDHSAK